MNKDRMITPKNNQQPHYMVELASNHRIHLSRTAAETRRLSAGLGIAAVRAGDAKAVRPHT